MNLPAGTLHRHSGRQFQAQQVELPTVVELRRAVQQEHQRRIRQLAAEGWSNRQIELAVFGYAGGHAHQQVKAVLG